MDVSLQKRGFDLSKVPPPVLASEEPIVRFFSYHDAHPVAIMFVLMEKFGVDWFEWEVETLKYEILQTFKATSISEHNWQKIQAIRTLTSDIGFWVEWHIFEKIIQALNNNVPRFDISQRCTVAQLMAGVDIADQIRDENYDEEIQRYTAACFLDEGVVYAPAPLDYAQTYLSQPMYRCRVCGKVDLDDLDGKCDFCCGRFTQEHALSMKPNPKLPSDAGLDVEKFLLRDPKTVEKSFEEVRGKEIGTANLSEESPESLQVAKLMVAENYMNERRRQLVEQLEELKSWLTH